MRYSVIPVTLLQQNCTLVWCEETRKGVVIDPGGEVPRILKEIARREVQVERVLITHGHLDHAGGAAALARHLQAPIEGPHEADRFLLDLLPWQGQMLGLEGESFLPERWLAEGDSIVFGKASLEVRHCPGHTPGHVVYANAKAGFAQVGDVLFAGSIGRTDLPGGDTAALTRSIKEKLWPLGDGTVFVPGHGPASTIGKERLSNPFVADRRG